jgi:hypothetical protein
VRSQISTNLDLLGDVHWHDSAFERFSVRGDDVERCTGFDMRKFADCRLHRDETCAIRFMQDARAAIEVP